jgi:hypothetical protein
MREQIAASNEPGTFLFALGIVEEHLQSLQEILDKSNRQVDAQSVLDKAP